jgi:hypothetical protein
VSENPSNVIPLLREILSYMYSTSFLVRGGVKRPNARVRVVVGLSEIVVTETWSEDSS